VVTLLALLPRRTAPALPQYRDCLGVVALAGPTASYLGGSEAVNWATWRTHRPRAASVL
jgi:hypothetical protein